MKHITFYYSLLSFNFENITIMIWYSGSNRGEDPQKIYLSIYTFSDGPLSVYTPLYKGNSCAFFFDCFFILSYLVIIIHIYKFFCFCFFLCIRTIYTENCKNSRRRGRNETQFNKKYDCYWNSENRQSIDDCRCNN